MDFNLLTEISCASAIPTYYPVLYNDTTVLLRPAMSSSEQAPKLERLLAVTHDLESATDMEQLVQRLKVAASELTGSEAASILQFDEASNSLHFVAASWFRQQSLKDIVVPLEGSIAGWVFGNNEPLIVQDVANDPRIQYPEEAKNEGIVSILSIPLKAKDQVIGVLRVYTGVVREFTDKEMDLMYKLAEQAGIAVMNAKLYQGIKNDYESLKKELPPHFKDRLSEK